MAVSGRNRARTRNADTATEEVAVSGNPAVDESATPAPAANNNEAATTIVWSDEGEAPTAATEQTPAYAEGAVDDQVVGGDAPAATTEVASDERIDAATTEGATAELEQHTDKDTAEKAGKIIGESNSAATALERLIVESEKNIRSLEDKRRNMKLLALGLSLLGGKSSAQAAQIANSIAGSSDERIAAMYAERGKLMDQARKAVFGDTGKGDSVFGDTYVDGEGNLYYKYKDRAGYEGPDGPVQNLPAGSVKQGTQGADLPASVQKSVNTLIDDADANDTNAERFDYIIEDIDEHGGAEGIFGQVGEFLKNTFGWQGGTSEWKTKYRDLKNSTAINNLPPGVASDRDIQIVMAGFPDEHWDKEQLKSWIKGYQKLLRYQASYKRFRADWMTEHRGRQAGMREAWVESETYKEWTQANVQTDEGGSGETQTTSTGVTYKVVG